LTESRPFQPIERTTVSERIRAELLSRIDSGELAPGSPLPSERALTEQFGVARTSVREAIQGLATLGVIQRRSNRAYVTEKLPDVNMNGDDERKDLVRSLFETRRVLELPIFELAACRATAAEREEIVALAGEFTDDLEILEFRLLDRRFHTKIASACGNPLLVELYGKVIEALFQSEAFTSLLYDEANEAGVTRLVARAGTDHRAIAAAIAAGDPVAVLEASEGHLRNVEHHMVDDLF